jgi:O-antigen ligase
MVGDERWLRAYGLAQHPNLLAGCLVAMLILIAAYSLRPVGRQRGWILAALALGQLAALLTFSRAAWLGGLLGGAVMLAMAWWARRSGEAPARGATLLLLGVVGAVTLAFAVVRWPLLRPRLGLAYQGAEVRSLEARALQLSGAWDLISTRPALGVGLGNYPTALYTLARDTIAAYPVYQPVHNVALLVTAELGLAGGLAWGIVLIAPWMAIWLQRSQARMTIWFAAVSGALASVSLVSFFDAYPWSSHQGRLLLWLIWALWAKEWATVTGGR